MFRFFTKLFPAVSAIIVAAALGLAAAGCAMFRTGKDVDVRIVGLQFTDITPFESTGMVTVRVTNSSNDPIQVDGARCSLYLNNVHAGLGVTNEPCSIPRLSSAVLTLAISMDNLSSLQGGLAALRASEVEYKLEGVLYTKGSLFRGTSPLTSGGKIRLNAPPEPPPPTPRAGNGNGK